MRGYRPHIPLKTRVEVAERQLGECFVGKKLTARLAHALLALFGTEPVHLDHDPPLAARHKRLDRAGNFIEYDPPANSAPHLIYREVEDHRVKTYIRGEHGQLPDRVLINRAKRREKKVAQVQGGRATFVRPKAKIRGLTFQQQRCRQGPRCSCSAGARKRCAHYRS